MLFLFISRLFLVVLVFVFSAVPSLHRRLFFFRRFLLPALSLVIFAILFYLARQQFTFWHSVEFTRSFVPPLNPSGIGYFLSFIYYHLFGEFIFSLIGAYVFLGGAFYVNKYFENRFFYEEELYFGAAGIFLIGYPGLIYYLFIFLIVYLLLQISAVAYWGESKRITPYYLWLPLALLLIVAQYFWGSKLPYMTTLVL